MSSSRNALAVTNTPPGSTPGTSTSRGKVRTSTLAPSDLQTERAPQSPSCLFPPPHVLMKGALFADLIRASHDSMSGNDRSIVGAGCEAPSA